MFTKNLWRSTNKEIVARFSLLQKQQQKPTLQRARLDVRIRKLDCGQYPSNRCVEMRAQVDRVGSSTRDFNNSNDVRKFFNKIDGK
jgi:hypothetical protein